MPLKAPPQKSGATFWHEKIESRARNAPHVQHAVKQPEEAICS